jgi:hypothetical protein
MIRWMLSAPAFATVSMSLLTPREALQISARNPASAISFTASISPSETAAKPASITSTPNSSSRLAMRSLFSGVKDTPGVCSPSRRVVSKTLIFSGKLLNKAIPHFPSHTSPEEKKPPTYKIYDSQIHPKILNCKSLRFKQSPPLELLIGCEAPAYLEPNSQSLQKPIEGVYPRRFSRDYI